MRYRVTQYNSTTGAVVGGWDYRFKWLAHWRARRHAGYNPLGTIWYYCVVEEVEA